MMNFLIGIWGMKFVFLPFILFIIFTGLYEAIENKWTKEKGVK